MKPETLQACEWFMQAQLLLIALVFLGCMIGASRKQDETPSPSRKGIRR